MKKNKIGIIFLVPMLAIAGIGISYAGFTDVIHVYGTVDTATVDIDWIGWYSGTWVYKIWGFEVTPRDPPPGHPISYDIANEVLIYKGFEGNVPTNDTVVAWAELNSGHAELVSSAWAEEYVGSTNEYDINMFYNNLFPCINFSADFIFHYGGSIPAKINVEEIFPIITESDEYDALGIDFLTYLWNYSQMHPGYGAWVDAYFVQGYDQYGNLTDDIQKIVGWNEGGQIGVGTQLHYCDYVLVRLTIHLPQDNLFQGLTGHFSGKIGVIQWYDNCPTTPPTCPPPVFTTIDLEKQWYDGTWLDVNYSGGYFFLNVGGATQGPIHQWNLTLGTDTATTPPLAVGLHPFTLVGTPGTVFMNYWSAKGVNSSATYGTWQYHMHQIITGMEPLFYVKYDGTNYMLVDGLHRDFFGVDQYFTIPSDYIRGVYRVNGILKSECGSTSSVNIDIWIEWMM